MLVLTDILWMLPLLYPVMYLIWLLTRKEWFAKRHLLHYSIERTAIGEVDGLLPNRLLKPEDYEAHSESDHDEIEDQADEQFLLFNRYGSCQ